ncbi:alpha-amylase family glycosyl hydrolase [Anditalea andensis]|uniref:Glycosyl hydrolase family 13 catalytic domain-containing protein n=1 Tax=Anditalea andensis TaxID=1048983 RepID=A0A074KZE9_9BACT|nr:alpha-amylase family glycosyl hydrolase [Anditalea andensis]KEO75366.1 hypothetical protein EL17_02170 [Anditalea andensis]
MKNTWYKDSIVYGVDIKLFQDSNDNGYGDIRGLMSRMDYIIDLGINTLWLQPFYPSPLRDFGYDISDFLGIDPRLGNMDDFLNLIKLCDENRIRVIIDLVINHTSVDHPWFIQAKSDKDSPYRNYYIWRDEEPENEEKKVMFEGVEDSVWEYVAETSSFYLHSYYKEQADLNIASLQVREEVFKVIKFWLNLGVSGFRIDAAHALTDTVSNDQTTKNNLNEFLDEIRKYTENINPDAILLAEADVDPKDIQDYFGKGDRMHMLFNFFSNQYNFLAMARNSGEALVKGLELTKHVQCKHYLNFVRHHDELNINQLDSDEQKDVLEKFAPDEKMRIYGHGGIKRQLVPMMENDIKKIKLMYVSIFGLPGSPLIHFGEEIGMGEDLNRKLRSAVRIPMQWSDQMHGGFSKAPIDKLNHKPLSNGDYSYSYVNVEKQVDDPASLLSFMKSLIKKRKSCTEIGHGTWDTLSLENDKLLAIVYQVEESKLLVICNFSSKKEKGKLGSIMENDDLVDLLSDSEYKKPSKSIEVNGYGYRWIKVVNQEKII